MRSQVLLLLLASGIDSVIWAQGDWITVAEGTRTLVRNPAGDFVRLKGAKLSFERPATILIEARFSIRPGRSQDGVTRVTVYKWDAKQTDTDCTKKPCWVEVQQLSNYGASASSYKVAVRTGDRLLLSVFDPAAGMTRGGDPAELRVRDRDRYYSREHEWDDKFPEAAYLESDSVAVRIRAVK